MGDTGDPRSHPGTGRVIPSFSGPFSRDAGQIAPSVLQPDDRAKAGTMPQPPQPSPARPRAERRPIESAGGRIGWVRSAKFLNFGMRGMLLAVGVAA